VPIPVSYAHRCSGPPHRTHGFWLDPGAAAALTRGSALGMRVQLRGFASVGRCLGSDCVLLLVVGSVRLLFLLLDLLDSRPPCSVVSPALLSFVVLVLADYCSLCESPLTITRTDLLYVVVSRFLPCRCNSLKMKTRFNALVEIV
jgi:hypothetical protein